MDCFVYVLGTSAKRRHLTYVGWTNDITRRLKQHNAGKGAKYTRGRRPVVLVYQEAAIDRAAAQRREAEIKRMRLEIKRQLVESQRGARK